MPELRCRTCGRSYSLGIYPRGCLACVSEGKLGTLEVAYPYDEHMRQRLLGAFGRVQRHSVWRFDCLLPLSAEDADLVTLGEGGTPLVEATWLRELASLEHVYLKNETANPTWCSKDRGNPVSVSVGRALKVPGVVAVTTGNHGASTAAYCARARLPVIVLCAPFSDVVHRAMIAAYGGTAIVAADREKILRHLMHEHGWYAVTSMADQDAANPFGVEGFKTIAFEIYEDLCGVPEAVFVPTASGDLLYGIYKGFKELAALGLTSTVPRMIGCQAEGAAPLALALREHLEEVPVLPNPSTVAYSVGDATSGKHALDAVVASGGDVITLSDAEIVQAQRRLAANGLLMETASATTLAALSHAAQSRLLRSGDRAVCLLTGTAVKWSAQLISSAMGQVLIEPTLSQVAAVAQANPSVRH